MHTSLRHLLRDGKGFARPRALAACLLAGALAAASAVRAPSSRAAFANTLTVTNTDDSGAGSLRQAIADAAPGDTIDFSLPPGSIIQLGTFELFITKSLNINGPGPDALTVSALGRSHRIFRVMPGVTAVISGLTIHGGTAFSFATDAPGGGGVHNAGTLTLTDCVVANNMGLGLPIASSGTALGGGINNTGTLTLTNTTVRDNVARRADTSPVGSGFGGGIISSGTLILTNSTVTRNSASNVGGIVNFGTLIMTNSIVSNNSSAGSGGGGVDNVRTMTADGCSIVNNYTGETGGGVNSFGGTLTLTNCTVSGNQAERGGGISSNGTTTTVTNSTVSGNLAYGDSADDGAADGGGVFSSGDLTMINSTVSGNEARGNIDTTSGGPSVIGGKASGGGILTQGPLALTNCTVTLNAAVGGLGDTSSAEGGGVLVRGAGTAKPLNTIVAGNSVRGNSSAGGASDTLAAPDVSGTFASQGHNLVGRNDGAQASFPAGTPNASNDIVGTSAAPVDAKLGPLSGNGGPTRTHRPWPGSPAVEGGDNVVLGAPHNLTTDQRGTGFPRLFDAFVDIGAVEVSGASPAFAFAPAAAHVGEDAGGFDVTVTRAGGLDAGDTSIDFSATDGTASSRSDFDAVFGTLRFDAGETSKSFTVFITDDAYAEGDEAISLTLSNPTGGATLGTHATATLTIDDNDSTPPTSNPIDDSRFFVRQHYVDFLGRGPDAPGLDFWRNEIDKCVANAQCRAVRRINVSAAFFLSTEFQRTGFFALRVRRAAFGNRSAATSRVTLADFLRDARQLGEEVVVGADGWEQRLEQNRLEYLARMVQTQSFHALYPESLTAAGYVDALFLSAGVTPTAKERATAISLYAWGGTSGRAVALRSVAESASVTSAEANPAFVLSEYFGYLRRNPADTPDTNDAGYNFWLSKLNQFDGDFVRAEMVKAFLSSDEYRKRFGNN